MPGAEADGAHKSAAASTDLLGSILRAAPELLPLPWAGASPNEAASSIRGNMRKASAGIVPISAQGKAGELCFCLFSTNYPCR